MKLRLAVSILSILLAPLGFGKTKLLVEDPNNVVVGRFGITASQAATATEAAETFLLSGKLQEVQKAYAIRYLAVDAGPLTAEQERKEPDAIAKAERRLGHYGVEFDPNRITHAIVIYDAIRHRVIHSRIYSVTGVPALYYYCRMDDYVTMYIGGWTGEGKEAFRK